MRTRPKMWRYKSFVLICVKIDGSALRGTHLVSEGSQCSLLPPQKLRTLHCVRQFGYEEDFCSHVPSPPLPPVCMFGNLREQVRLLFRYIERLLTATSTPLNMYSICRYSCICEGKDQDDLPSLLSCVMEAECVYVCVCPVNSATHICLKITYDLCGTIIDTVTTFE